MPRLLHENAVKKLCLQAYAVYAGKPAVKIATRQKCFKGFVPEWSPGAVGGGVVGVVDLPEFVEVFGNEAMKRAL